MKKFIFCTVVVLTLMISMFEASGCTGLMPNQTSEYYNRGVALADEGKYDEAIAEYNKAIEIDQNHTNSYVGLGYAYLMKKQYDLAITNYTRAIELDPEFRNAYNGRGSAYLYTKRYNLAALDFNKAIEIDPSFVQGNSNLGYVMNKLNQAFNYNVLGVTLAETGKYEDAVAAFSQAIEIYPYYPSAYTNRGLICIVAEQYDLAITQFDSAIYLDPGYARAYSSRGLAHIYTERYENALTDLDKALEIDQNEAIDWNNKGIALEQLGEPEEAADAFSKALQLEPDNDGIKSNITFNTKMIQEGGNPGGNKSYYGRYIPHRRWTWVKGEERTTETEFAPYTEPAFEGLYLGGVGLTGAESLIGEWINDGPRYGFVVSDGLNYWNYDAVLKIVDEVGHTGPMEAEQPSTFTGTLHTMLVSITGPITQDPNMMSGYHIGQTADSFVSGKHLGTSVELYCGDMTYRLEYDGHDFMGGTTEVNSQGIKTYVSFWLKRKR